MKTRFFVSLMALALVALFAFACKNKSEETTSTAQATDTYASTTSAPATDTSATSSTSTTSSAPATSTAPLDKADAETVTKIAQANMAEVAAGQMAASKAQSTEVKDFANRMVSDHGKAGDELKALATAKNATLPSDVDKDQKAAADKLSKTAAGIAFDKAYLQQMVKDHEGAVAAFTKTSKDAKDPDLKSWAAKTLPTIQDHLKMAKDLAGKMK